MEAVHPKTMQTKQNNPFSLSGQVPCKRNFVKGQFHTFVTSYKFTNYNEPFLIFFQFPQ